MSAPGVRTVISVIASRLRYPVVIREVPAVDASFFGDRRCLDAEDVLYPVPAGVARTSAYFPKNRGAYWP